jgi:hypothetical protein
MNLRSLIFRIQVEAWSRIHPRFPRISFGLPQRAGNPYATHVPALVGISAIIEPARVVEFGCGLYSTSTFLNRNIFPKLIELLSFENDLRWAESIAPLASKDPRLHILSVEGAMHVAARGAPLAKYDLLFVDDSTCVEDRCKTIEAVGDSVGSGTAMLIHDFEVHDYRRALPHGIRVFVFDAFMPLTAVCWKGRMIDPRRLRATNERIKRLARRIAPEAADAWYDALYTSSNQP